MTTEATHASFFSGAGGLDLGLERAGWRTVSFSEIDPYACAILRQRWPDVPNLGDIQAIGTVDHVPDGRHGSDPGSEPESMGRPERADDRWTDATLWSGGFPCQDLSVAGKRAGLAGERSGLAYTFLDLVGRHRPPAVILENVPGLLSSHAGRDLGVLLGRLGQLRYGWAFRVLDLQWFGVPQRRRRVFILALDTERYPDEYGAAEILAVGSRCGRDHPQEREAWADAAGRTGDGAIGTIREHVRPGSNTDRTVVDGPTSDPDRVRAPDGLAGRVDGGGGVASTIQGRLGKGADAEGAAGGQLVVASLGHSSPRGDGTDNLVPELRDGVREQRGDVLGLRRPGAGDMAPVSYVKGKRAQTTEDDESWRAGDVSPTINAFDVGDTRATTLALDGGRGVAAGVIRVTGDYADPVVKVDDLPMLAANPMSDRQMAVFGQGTGADATDPEGLDSHRYRTIGNGVGAPVAEWIGRRLREYLT